MALGLEQEAESPRKVPRCAVVLLSKARVTGIVCVVRIAAATGRRYALERYKERSWVPPPADHIAIGLIGAGVLPIGTIRTIYRFARSPYRTRGGCGRGFIWQLCIAFTASPPTCVQRSTSCNLAT
jgi:hypothetical protein